MAPKSPPKSGSKKPTGARTGPKKPTPPRKRPSAKADTTKAKESRIPSVKDVRAAARALLEIAAAFELSTERSARDPKGTVDGPALSLLNKVIKAVRQYDPAERSVRVRRALLVEDVRDIYRLVSESKIDRATQREFLVLALTYSEFYSDQKEVRAFAERMVTTAEAIKKGPQDYKSWKSGPAQAAKLMLKKVLGVSPRTLDYNLTLPREQRFYELPEAPFCVDITPHLPAYISGLVSDVSLVQERPWKKQAAAAATEVQAEQPDTDQDQTDQPQATPAEESHGSASA